MVGHPQYRHSRTARGRLPVETYRKHKAQERSRQLRRGWDQFVATQQPDFREGEAAHKHTFQAGFDAAGAPETYGILPTEVPDRS